MDSVTRENWRCWQRLQLPMTRYLNNLNLREIVRHLYQDQLLTLSEMESFSNDQRTAALNVIRLTSCLSRKGPNCIQLFLGCLKRAGDVSGRRDVLTAIASDPESPETIRVDVGKWLVTHTPVRAVDSVLFDLPEEGDGWGRGQEGWLAEVQHDGGRNGDEFSLESGFFSQEHQSAPEGTDSGLGKRSQAVSDVAGLGAPTVKRKRSYSPQQYGSGLQSRVPATEFASQYITNSFSRPTGEVVEHTYVEILRGCQSWFESYISLLPLIPHLNWLGVLTPEEQDTLINTEHSEQSRIRGLLEMIVQKGAEGYRQFIEAVHREETHIGHRSLLTCIDNIRRGAAMPDRNAVWADPSFHLSTNGDMSPFDEYRSYLHRYYQQKMPVHAEWAPQFRGAYISLASIKKDSQSQKELRVNRTEADVYTQATLHGNVEDILKVKESVEIHQVAMPLPGHQQPRCVLVEGAPGVGKTTFAWELCRGWGERRLLNSYSCVVLLRLREERIQKATRLSDLFFYTNTSVSESVARRFEKNQGKDLLLLLEGFDEYPVEKQTPESLIGSLVSGRALPDATVLVTTRPSAYDSLIELCQTRVDQHIEIIGFTRDNVNAYIAGAFRGDVPLQSGFKTYLDCYPHIRTMMYVPLLCAIVVEVYQNSSSNPSMVPKTMTDLYSSLARCLLIRYLKKQKKQQGNHRLNIRCFRDLPPDDLCKLYKLSELAYEGLRGDKVNFSSLPEGVDYHGLGLMQFVPELYIDEGFRTSYNFVHLTLQEYLAAVHLSTQSQEQQIEAFKSQQLRMKVMLRFLAGITKFEGIPEEVLRGLLIKEAKKVREISLDGLHWLFEAQYNDTDLSSLLGPKRIGLDWTWTTPSAFDCYVLGRCIAQSKCGWELSMTECDIGDDGLEVLAKGIGPHPTGHISCIRARGNGISQVGMRHLLGMPRRVLRKLTEIELGNNKIDKETCDLLAKRMKHIRRLETISLSGNPLGPGGAVKLLKAMKSLPKCSLLSLFSTSVGLEDSRILAQLLTSSMDFDTIYIGGNQLIRESADLLVRALHGNKSLKHLFIAGAALSPTLLSSVLRSNEQLVELDIRYCSINSEGAGILAEALKDNKSLLELYIDGNPIGDDGAIAIAGMLQVNQTLESLWINETVGENGIHHIIESLRHNTSLKQLVLNLKDTYRVKTVRSHVEQNHEFQSRVEFMNDTVS